ncbi:MAG: HD domain-containing protein [Gammaproteobacteria bacterium]|jgi:hypothetical protein
MQLITDNAKFIRDYRKLESVSLNPERHAAPNAYEHCERVVDRIKQLALQNGCSDDETTILVNLAYVHDIGKTQGNAKPEESVALLPKYGHFVDSFVSLVKYHDVNLPWYISHSKGQAPSDKAWRKLAGKVDLRLLCLFMIADRVDCPGGWQQNKALVWFLGQCRKRNYVTEDLVING